MMEEIKKEYLQPVIDIEYYEGIVLCAGFETDSPSYNEDNFGSGTDDGTW